MSQDLSPSLPLPLSIQSALLLLERPFTLEKCSHLSAHFRPQDHHTQPIRTNLSSPLMMTSNDFVSMQYSSNNFYSSPYIVSNNFCEEDELPILEELGINLTHIRKKTLTVLNPFGKIDEESLKDNDLAGPLFFALLLGMFLLLVSFVLCESHEKSCVL
jgi:hypothetical protein